MIPEWCAVGTLQEGPDGLHVPAPQHLSTFIYWRVMGRKPANEPAYWPQEAA